MKKTIEHSITSLKESLIELQTTIENGGIHTSSTQEENSLAEELHTIKDRYDHLLETTSTVNIKLKKIIKKIENILESKNVSN